MIKSRRLTAIAISSGVLAVGAGLGVATVASADPTATPSPSASSTAAPGTKDGHDRGPRGHRGGGFGMGGDLAKTLAEKLGVTEDKVSTAMKEIHEANKPTEPPTKTDRPDQAKRDAAIAKQLAEKLGVSEDMVTKALSEIREAAQAEHAAALKERLDAAVKDGTLTQAEADAVTKAVEKGVIPGGGRR